MSNSYCFLVTTPEPGCVGAIELRKDATTLDPCNYAEWMFGAEHLRKIATTQLEDLHNFETWMAWSKQATDPRPDDELERVWLSLPVAYPNNQPATPDQFSVEIDLATNHITVTRDIFPLDPSSYNEWVMGGAAIKSMGGIASHDAFTVWMNWSKQSPKAALTTGEMFVNRWASFGSPNRQTAELSTPVEDRRMAEPLDTEMLLVESKQNAIATLLDRHTGVVGPNVYVRDLGGLQSELNKLIAEPPAVVDPLVLKSRGNTLLDLIAQGLITDDDMANHMADCFTSITGKHCTAKHAQAFIGALRGLQTLLEAGDATARGIEP